MNTKTIWEAYKKVRNHREARAILMERTYQEQISEADHRRHADEYNRRARFAKALEKRLDRILGAME